MSAVLILGATSAIARSAANSFASKGYSLFLAGREIDELNRIASDIKIRFQVDVKTGIFDAQAFNTHESFFQNVVQQMKDLEGVLLAFGELGDQKRAIIDFNQTLEIINCNYVGACSILTYCANFFGKKDSGFIIAITSVAGDRGRQSNYVYGSAKSGLNTFLEGLRNRLYPANVKVVTIKPGFVDTQMTYGNPKMFLVANPDDIGKKIAATVNKSKDIYYLPFFWRYIMTIIKIIPESIFKRLKL